MKNILKDIFLFLTLVALLFLGRTALLCLFNLEAEIPSLNWYVMSLRFDLMSASYICLPTIILTVISLFVKNQFGLLKFIYAYVAIFLIAMTAAINIGFFETYKSQFNYWIFGIFLDELKPIISFILSNYSPFLLIFVIVAALIIFYLYTKFAFKKIDALNFKKANIWIRIPTAIVYIFVCFILMRGANLKGRPLQMRDASVTPSSFLNNLIPSSIYCIKTEIMNFILQSCDKGLSEFSASPEDMPQYVKDLWNTDSLDNALSKTVKASNFKNKPKRIFFILGESHSAWPLFEEYSNLNLMPQTKELLKDSLYSKSALPSGGGTMAAVTTLISGVPFSGRELQSAANANTDFALAPILKKLGYTCDFYYAGQSTWRQIGEFAKYFGFDRFIGGQEMGTRYNKVEWGVRDKDLFEHILSQNIPEHSFSFILTVSNHEPYDVDLISEGYPYKLDTKNQKRLAHTWYADKYIGIFVKRILEKYPDSLIIITGDHPSRTSPENLVLSTDASPCVPVIFYGDFIKQNNLKKEVQDTSQLDIYPTLIEILAPDGFKYKAWGESILNDSERKLMPISSFNIKSNGRTYSLNTRDCPDNLKETARKYLALSNYYAKKRDKK